MPSDETLVHELRAVNLSAESENKIHDDTVARTYGFTGALVPGVEVYAYMTHAPLAKWGRAWLERGSADCRFVSPVYHNTLARVSALETGGDLDLSVAVGQKICATGRATVPASALAPFTIDTPYRAPPTAKETRPHADEDTLAAGTVLCTAPTTILPADAASYRDGVSESNALYCKERLVHPGQILRLANRALVDNVVLGPWVHVGSHIQNHDVARVGETLTLIARVTKNYLRKGHSIVEFEAVVSADNRPIASIVHSAIWRLRS